MKNLLLRDLQIVTKSCRETHCHFCFNEVPTDVLFCPSCTVPIYCSQHCQELAGGEQFLRNRNGYTTQKHLSADLEKHVVDTILANHSKCAVTNLNFKHIPEHKHECGGAHWSAILPPDVVLAGRVMMQSVEKRKVPGEFSKPRETLEFAHNYVQIPSDSKLEFHIYAAVLSYCLEHYYSSDFPADGATASQLVLLISQIKINSMAVVHMKSLDGYGALEKSQKLSAIDDVYTCALEQVKVGQAIYSTGSLFNHSCQPNIHAYFLSRTLFLRSTEFVPAWYPLELSYGPQVGQLDLQDRLELLKEQYSFKCRCTSCSELNLSDLVINAFRCIEPDCPGAVLEMTCYEKLEDDFVQVPGASDSCKLSLPVSKKKTDLSKVASMLLQKTGVMCRFGPGCCLSCGSNLDLKSSSSASKSATMDIQRLKDFIASNIAPGILISDALKSLIQLRSVRHPYSRDVAQAEDNLAEAFVRIREFERAMQHCIASIEILEKLYHSKHIVIGHELMKLASIQLSLGDRTTARHNIKRLEAIFSLYYGSHVSEIFPYIEDLRREVDNLAS